MKSLEMVTAGALSFSLLLAPICFAQDELGLPDKPAADQPAPPPQEQAKPAAQETKSAAQETIPLSSSKPTQQEVKIAGSTIIGTAVKNAQGEDLGEIKDLMIDAQSGRVTSALLAVGGTLGIGAKQVEIPWDTLKVGLGKEELIVEMDKEQLQNAMTAEATPPSPTAER